MRTPWLGNNTKKVRPTHFLDTVEQKFETNKQRLHLLWLVITNKNTLGCSKLGNKERLNEEQIGIKEPFLATNLPFTS